MSNKGMSEDMYNFIKDNLHRLTINTDKGIVITPKGTNGTVCSSTGYLKVKVNKKVIPVHQVLAVVYFGDACIGMQVNHRDGDKLKNFKDNIELVTRAENIQHQHDNGLAVYRKGYPIRQLGEKGETLATYESINEASRVTGVEPSNIASALRGYTPAGNTRYTAGGYIWEHLVV